ncbi:MAG: hypothetical protein EOP53_02585 [Sphingobacteriales bacterium]|nr:MAG: hypothetical protein EOP53_02585 [Sphingobacteriales bacterium]
MKIKKILSLIALSTLLLAGCKKDGGSSGNDDLFNEAGNISVGNDASGAMYSILSRTYIGTSGSDFDEDHVTTAWFGNATAPKDAGTVKSNNEELITMGAIGFEWYFSQNMDDIFTSGNDVEWTVGGNSTNGITGFSHLDANPFPTAITYNLPDKINVNNNFTLTHTNSGNSYAVLYRLMGYGGQVSKSVMGSSSSVTFTAGELQEVAGESGDPIGFLVMPVSIKSATYNGKKYYFVKQFQNLRETVSQ